MHLDVLALLRARGPKGVGTLEAFVEARQREYDLGVVQVFSSRVVWRMVSVLMKIQSSFVATSTPWAGPRSGAPGQVWAHGHGRARSSPRAVRAQARCKRC